MARCKKFSVIWKDKTRIEFYRNGIWDGKRFTQPTLIQTIHPKQLEGHMRLPQIYEAFRHFEKTGELPQYKV